jgi:hypothetical protein
MISPRFFFWKVRPPIVYESLSTTEQRLDDRVDQRELLLRRRLQLARRGRLEVRLDGRDAFSDRIDLAVVSTHACHGYCPAASFAESAADTVIA